MSKRSEAMRLENERVKRQTEQRLARKREKEEAMDGGVDEDDDKTMKPLSSSQKSRNMSWMYLAALALAAIALLAYGSSLATSGDEAAVPVDVGEESTGESTAAAGLDESPASLSLEETESTGGETNPAAGETSPAAGEIPITTEETPLVEETPAAAVSEGVMTPPAAPGAPAVASPPPDAPALPAPPNSPPKATMRWANLKLPEQCFMFPSAPHGVLPGLESYTFQKAETPVKIPVSKEEVEEESPAASTEEVEEEESSPATAEAEEESAETAEAEEESTATAEAVAESPEAEEEESSTPRDEAVDIASTSQSAAREELPEIEEGTEVDEVEEEGTPEATRRFSRRLLKKHPAAATAAAAAAQAQPEPAPAAAAAQQQPAPAAQANQVMDQPLLPTSTELQAMNLLLNVSAVDGSCQFVTKECAEAAAQELSRALRSDAEAVANPLITADELRRVTKNLASMHSNSRTLLNATELPSLGLNGDLGNCAVAGENEYDPDSGKRYDAFTSRFAVTIDRHDVLVHCAETLHYCTLTRLQGEQRSETVRIDAQSYLKAKEAGKQLHTLLAKDAELADGVETWGHEEEPTHSFITLMMLLRSGLCQRVDVYGQPGVPSRWYHNLGNGHIVTRPFDTKEDRELAKALQQERFLLRVAVHVFQGRLCFYK